MGQNDARFVSIFLKDFAVVFLARYATRRHPPPPPCTHRGLICVAARCFALIGAALTVLCRNWDFRSLDFADPIPVGHVFVLRFLGSSGIRLFLFFSF